MKLELSLIKIDGGTQARAGIDQDTVREYAEAIEDGSIFPPLTVFHDGTAYWLADGFHRYHAYKSLEALEVDVEIKQGERRDAVLYSVGANATHGLRRTNEDKRRAVQVLLEDGEWSQWSNGEIGRRAGVSDVFVGKLRKELTPNRSESTERKGADGRTINTAKIGKSQPAASRYPVTYSPPLTPEVPDEDDRPEMQPLEPDELSVIDPADATEFEELASQLVPVETPETRMKEALKREGYDEAERVGKHLAALVNYSDGRLMEIINSKSGQLLGLPRFRGLLMAELERKTLEVVG